MRGAALGMASAWLMGLTSTAWASGEGAAESAAANSDIEYVTVTATRLKASIADVPVTVSTIGSEEIDNRLIKDIKDLIRYEPGVSVPSSPARFSAALASTGRDGNSGFNIRGLDGNRVLIQIDGIRVPDAFSFGAQSVGRGDYVDLDLLKSVEILRGPASALYGSDGLAGAVSYITKDPEDFLGDDEVFGGRGRVGYASADQSWTEGAVGAFQSGRWQAMAAYTRRDGHELDNMGTNDASNTDRTMPNPQDAESNAVLAKLIFAPAQGQRLRLTYDHVDTRIATHVLSAIAKPPLGASSTLDLAANDNIERDRVSLDHRFEAMLGFIDSGSWVAYHQISTTREFTTEDRNTSPDRTRLNTFNNRVIGADVTLVSSAATGMFAHTFVYGADVSTTHQEGVRDGTIPPFGETFPTRAFPTTDYALAGLFAQDEIEIGDSGLALYPALRYDAYNLDPKPDPLFAGATAGQSDQHLSPKFGAVYHVTDALSAYASYASGFKAPAPSEVNNGFTNLSFYYTSIPNPNLKPETSETWEVGAKYLGEGWFGSASLFSGKYKDFIEQICISDPDTCSFVTAGPNNLAKFQYVNLGSVDISGAEAKLSREFASGFGFIAAASYAQGQAHSQGISAPLNSVDPWKLVAGVSWRDPAGRFGGELTATHAGQKTASRVDQANCATACFRPPAFTTLDVTAYWNVTEHATLRAGLFNLTDEKYWWWSDVRGLSESSLTRDAYTQPGRNVSLSLTLKI